MTKIRYLTEMGMGVDVHGGDYTKAACRAVADALRHSSLNFFNLKDIKDGATAEKFKIRMKAKNCYVLVNLNLNLPNVNFAEVL